MSITTYGLGIDTDTMGAVVTYGLGITPLGPVVNAAIAFNTNMDIEVVNRLTAGKDISFALDLLLSVDRQLASNPDITFDIEAAANILTQTNYYPEVIFNTNLSDSFIGEMITSAGLSLDVALTFDETVELIEFILEKQNLYVIAEELRFLSIFTQYRICMVEKDIRTESVKYENRTVIVSQGED